MNRRMVVVQRDCPARLVPAGTRITLPKDTFVTLTQALGGTYTVNVGGNLARVDGHVINETKIKKINGDFGVENGGQGLLHVLPAYASLAPGFKNQL